MRTKTLTCDDCGETMTYASKNVCTDCGAWLCDDCIDEHEIATCDGADDAHSHEEPTLCDALGHTFRPSAIDARFVICSRCHDVAMASQQAPAAPSRNDLIQQVAATLAVAQ